MVRFSLRARLLTLGALLVLILIISVFINQQRDEPPDQELSLLMPSPAPTAPPHHTPQRVVAQQKTFFGTGRIYVTSVIERVGTFSNTQGRVTAFDALSGAVLYIIEIPKPATQDMLSLDAQLSRDGHTLYISDASSVRALRAADGTELWRNSFRRKPDTSTYTRIAYISADGARLYLSIASYAGAARDAPHDADWIQIVDTQTGTISLEHRPYCEDIRAETADGLLVCMIHEQDPISYEFRTILTLHDPFTLASSQRMLLPAVMHDAAPAPDGSALFLLDQGGPWVDDLYGKELANQNRIRIYRFDLHTITLSAPQDIGFFPENRAWRTSLRFDQSGKHLLVGQTPQQRSDESTLIAFALDSWQEQRRWTSDLRLSANSWGWTPDGGLLIGLPSNLDTDNRILRYRADGSPLDPLTRRQERITKILLGPSLVVVSPTALSTPPGLVVTDTASLAWLAFPRIPEERYRNDALWRTGVAEGIFPAELRSINGQGQQSLIQPRVYSMLPQPAHAPLLTIPRAGNAQHAIIDPMKQQIIAQNVVGLLSPDRAYSVTWKGATGSLSILEMTQITTGITRTFGQVDDAGFRSTDILMAWSESGIYGSTHDRWLHSIWRIDPFAQQPAREHVFSYEDGAYALNTNIPLLIYTDHDLLGQSSVITATMKNPVTQKTRIMEMTKDGWFSDYSIAPDGRTVVYLYYHDNRADLHLYALDQSGPAKTIRAGLQVDTAQEDAVRGWWYNEPITPFFWSPDSRLVAMLTVDPAQPLETQRHLLVFDAQDGTVLDDIQLTDFTGSIQLNNQHQVLMITYQGRESFFVVREIGTGKQSSPVPLGRETPLIVYVP